MLELARCRLSCRYAAYVQADGKDVQRELPLTGLQVVSDQ
jgi:hypothetical protein